MSKLLVVIFTVLLILVLGELSYVVFLGANPKFNPNSTASQSEITPTPTPFPDHAVNLNNLSMLSYWHKGVVSSVNANVELKGTIAEIATNGSVQEHGWSNLSYALKIKIKGSNDLTNDIYLTKDDLQKTVFDMQKPDGTSESINYAQLKQGDNIQIALVFDLTKDFVNNFVSAEITKL